MEDWAKKLNAFLRFNEKDILENAGKVTAAIAKSLRRVNSKNTASFRTGFFNQISIG